MSPRLARFVVLRFWRDALAVAVALSLLTVGLDLALLKTDEAAGLEALKRSVGRLLPLLPVPVCFLAGAIGAARMHAERTLIALACAGHSLRRVAAAYALAALPLCLFAFAFEAFPLGAGPVPERAAAWGSPLAGGGFFLRGAAGTAQAGRAAALLPAQERLLVGRALERGAADATARARVQLEVQEVWSLDSSAPRLEAAGLPAVTEPGVTEPGVTEPGVTEPGVTEPGQIWSGLALLAPRSLVFGAEAGPLRLATLNAWLQDEPQRADLRFARDARFASPLRVLCVLLLGLALWLRPTLAAFFPRAAWSALWVAAYLACELYAGSLGVTGLLPPTLAAVAPACTFGLIGLIAFERSLRPGFSR